MVYLLYLGQIRNPKNVLKQLGLSWKILQKSILPELRLIEPGRNALTFFALSSIPTLHKRTTLSKTKTLLNTLF